MPRIGSLALLLLVAACTTTERSASDRTCRSDPASRLVGQPATSGTGAEIVGLTGAAVLRWAAPGTALTMDFRPDRVTVRLGPDGKISRIDCG